MAEMFYEGDGEVSGVDIRQVIRCW